MQPKATTQSASGCASCIAEITSGVMRFASRTGRPSSCEPSPVKEGKFPFAFKDKKELTELVVKNNTSNVKNDGTYEIDINIQKYYNFA